MEMNPGAFLLACTLDDIVRNNSKIPFASSQAPEPWRWQRPDRCDPAPRVSRCRRQHHLPAPGTLQVRRALAMTFPTWSTSSRNPSCPAPEETT